MCRCAPASEPPITASRLRHTSADIFSSASSPNGRGDSRVRSSRSPVPATEKEGRVATSWHEKKDQIHLSGQRCDLAPTCPKSANTEMGATAPPGGLHKWTSDSFLLRESSCATSLNCPPS